MYQELGSMFLRELRENVNEGCLFKGPEEPVIFSCQDWNQRRHSVFPRDSSYNCRFPSQEIAILTQHHMALKQEQCISHWQLCPVGMGHLVIADLEASKTKPVFQGMAYCASRNLGGSTGGSYGRKYSCIHRAEWFPITI